MMKWIVGILFLSQLALASAEVVADKNLAEDQIPLKIDTLTQSAKTQGEGTKLMLTLVILTGVFGASYYLLRKYSFKNNSSTSNMQIKILSQHYLGPKKSLAIVRVAGESMLIGITDQNINMIKSLSLLDEELPQVLPQNFDATLTEDNDLVQAAEQIED